MATCSFFPTPFLYEKSVLQKDKKMKKEKLEQEILYYTHM